jgi:hypothetical protein
MIFVSVPLALCSCGGFRTDHAPDLLLESPPLGTQPSSSREQEIFSGTLKFERMKSGESFVPLFHCGKQESVVPSLLCAEFKASDFQWVLSVQSVDSGLVTR